MGPKSAPLSADEMRKKVNDLIANPKAVKKLSAQDPLFLAGTCSKELGFQDITLTNAILLIF